MTPPEALPRVLAIDGGNSKTDLLLVASDGSVLASVRGPGASPQALGPRRSVAEFERMAAEAATRAGRAARPPFAEHTATYLAGLDLPREEQEFRDALLDHGWSASTEVGNDTFALLRSGTPDGIGIAVVCGAGTNCVARAPDGRIHRFPALGKVSGDWGGGRQLGDETLWHAVRAEDGRGPRTALLPAVREHFGLSRAADVAEALHFGEIAQTVVHELCPVLFRVAETGDEVACSLVDRQIEEIALLASVSARRLDVLSEPLPVVLGGGVLAGMSQELIDEIARRCRKVVPRALVHRARIPPVAGAALLGLDTVGTDERSAERLIGHFATADDDPA